MIDEFGEAHRRADCVLNRAAAVVMAGLIAWAGFSQYTVSRATAAFQPASSVLVPDRVAVTPAAAVFANATEDQSECLAEVLYYEARGEGMEGQKAVAEVVLQRTRDGNYPRTICGVVYEGVQSHKRYCQFSFACDGALRQPKETTSWARVRRLAEAIVSGAVRLAGETRHAIAYHSVDVEPLWAETMVETAQIGNHIFYRRDPSRLNESGATTDRPANPERTAPQAPVTPGSEEIQTQIETADAVSQGA
jgi:hypothetical protein